MQIFEEYDKDKCTTSNELISLFSQYFFDYFNSLNKNKKIVKTQALLIPKRNSVNGKQDCMEG